MAFPVVLRLKWKGREIRGDDDRPEGVPIKKWGLITKAANRAMGFMWHAQFLPRHFGSDAAKRYRGVYKQRTSKWLARKLGIANSDVNREANLQPSDTTSERQAKRRNARQRLVSQAGGQNFNVYTGTLKQMVTSVVVMRAFPGRFRLEMPTPAYLPGRRRDPNQPDIRGELTAMLTEEMKAMQSVGQRVLVKSVRQLLQTGNLPDGV